MGDIGTGQVAVTAAPGSRRELAWRERGACQGVADPDVFFPVGTSAEARWQTGQAKAVCAGCPVRSACLRWALETREPDGIWGGWTLDERLAALEEIRKARGADEVTGAGAGVAA